MSDAAEQICGALLMLVGIVDLFLSVLYARIGSGRGSRFGMGLSRWVARGCWAACCWLGRRSSRARPALLSVCAPFSLVVLAGLWASILTVGAAMIVQPALRSDIQETAGPGGTDFATALYVAGTSLSVISSSDFTPRTRAFRGLFLLNALIGTAAVTLTINYLMQIYRALQTRNALGLKVERMSAGTRSGAELVARWGPEGRFPACYSSMVEIVGELAEVHEAHHLYPMLFYFRFDTEYANLVVYLPALLDAATVLQCVLDEREYGWLQRSAAVCQLRDGSLQLLNLLDRVFVPQHFPANAGGGAGDGSGCRERFRRAIEILRGAGIVTVDGSDAEFDRYAASLDAWRAKAARLAAYLEHGPATSQEGSLS
jgi:hypothetical protein